MIRIFDKTLKSSSLRVAWRIWRLVVFLLGVFSVVLYFWSFVGVIIGTLYYLLAKEVAWKRNGLILSFYAAIGAIFLLFYEGSIVTAIDCVLIFTFGYLGVLIVFKLVEKKGNQFFKRIVSLKNSIHPKNVKIKRFLKIGAVLTPILLWSSVSIDLGVIIDNNTRSLWINAPSNAQIGDEFELTVEAWDGFERLSANYQGTVEFSIESYDLDTLNLISNPTVELPNSYTFTGQSCGSDIAYEIKDGKDNGRHVFSATIGTRGIHYILVEDSYMGIVYYSNPIEVGNFSKSDDKIYWGDIHTHSILSDGAGMPDHNFYYGRYIAHLDFMAITDHGEMTRYNPSAIDILESSANCANDPNSFVTFHGIEWTDVPTGHYTCIFEAETTLRSPILDSYFVTKTPEDLWKALDDFTSQTNSRALALPHHTVKKSYMQDWTYLNPKYVRIAEVTSVHGESLFEQRHELSYRGAIDPPPKYTNGSSIVDALRMGYRLTLYASSDGHDGHPGHSLSHTRAKIGHQRPFNLMYTRTDKPHTGGLVAVRAQNLTRKGVFDGLYSSKVYAVSDHGRLLLSFTLNGKTVGQGSTVIVDNQTAKRNIRVFVAQDGAPAFESSPAFSMTSDWTPNWHGTIEIIKNGKLWRSEQVSSAIVKREFTDIDPIIGASYKNSCVYKNGEYFINQYSDNPIDPVTLNTGGFDFYLVRFVGENGRTAYAGPIWVEY